jgi:hypothetical protein
MSTLKRGAGSQRAHHEPPFARAMKRTATELGFILEGGDSDHALEIGIGVLKRAKKPRNRDHELATLIKRTDLALRSKGKRPAAREVMNALLDYDEEGVIQEIRNDTVYWRDRANGEHKTTLATLRNKLAAIRKQADPPP